MSAGREPPPATASAGVARQAHADGHDVDQVLRRFAAAVLERKTRQANRRATAGAGRAGCVTRTRRS